MAGLWARFTALFAKKQVPEAPTPPPAPTPPLASVPPPAEDDTSRVDFYKPSERLIYSYWDGKEVRRVDPMELWLAWCKVGMEISVADQVRRSPSKTAAAAHVEFCAGVRSLFGVTTLAEGGLTDAEVTQLLNHFLWFCDTQKKSTSPSSMPAPTESPATESSRATSPPTPNSSVSGSTPSGSSTAPPTPSTSELPSPAV